MRKPVEKRIREKMIDNTTSEIIKKYNNNNKKREQIVNTQQFLLTITGEDEK